MILRKKNIKEFISQKRKSFVAISPIIASAFTLMVFVPVSWSYANIRSHSLENSVATGIAFNKKQNVVELTAEKAKIIPGESAVLRQIREEAEAKAQAEAEARAAEESASRNVVSRERHVYSDPANFDSIYQRAESAFGVDARLLKAIHYVETGCSGSTAKSSYAGAVGPMQFLPSTFRVYGTDGNGDGIADITNVEDAIFTAARYLVACGYPNVKSALYGYNPSYSYYAKVLDVASSLGYGR